MTTERDARILAEHHEIAGGRIAEAARDASPVPAEPATPALDLDAVEARVPDGYDAPWRVEPSESGEWLVAYATDCPQAGLVATVPDYGWTLAEFIAAARSDVPTLTAEVRRLRAVLDVRAEPAGIPASPAALDLGRCWCCESATGAAPDAVNDAPIEHVSTQEIEGSKG